MPSDPTKPFGSVNIKQALENALKEEFDKAVDKRTCTNHKYKMIEMVRAHHVDTVRVCMHCGQSPTWIAGALSVALSDVYDEHTNPFEIDAPLQVVQDALAKSREEEKQRAQEAKRKQQAIQLDNERKRKQGSSLDWTYDEYGNRRPVDPGRVRAPTYDPYLQTRLDGYIDYSGHAGASAAYTRGDVERLEEYLAWRVTHGEISIREAIAERAARLPVGFSESVPYVTYEFSALAGGMPR